MAPKICIVDDETEIVDVVHALLRSKGYETFSAEDGTSGMRLIEEVEPDLVILDLVMPGMSGMEMCKRLRASEKFRDIPIIVLSGIARNSDKSPDFWASGLNSDEFVNKPFEPLDLLGRVQYLLRRGHYVSSKNNEQPSLKEKVIDNKELAEARPHEVVKMFIESWNHGDFGTEYECLGEEMRFGLSKRDYASRRYGTYKNAGGDQTEQHYKKSISEKLNFNMATVVCLRENRKGGRTEQKEETYTLRQTTEGWKIINVRSKNS